MISNSISRRSAITGGACLAAAVGIAGAMTPRAALAESAPDFQGIIDELEDDEQECCTAYEDGSGMLIDTNPKDADGGNWIYTTAGNSAIEKIFDQLKLPKIFLGMFGECSASDGWQSRIRGNYEITWKYYPDTGLRVFIEWLG